MWGGLSEALTVTCADGYKTEGSFEAETAVGCDENGELSGDKCVKVCAEEPDIQPDQDRAPDAPTQGPYLVGQEIT